MTSTTDPDDAFGGAKLFVLSGDRLVSLLRDDIPGIAWPGHWDLPGGGREGNETPAACVLRETREETGLILAETRLIWRRRYWGSTPGGSWFFAAEISLEEEEGLRLGDEGQQLCLMPIAEFLSHPRAVPHFRHRLADYLKDRGR